MSRAPELRPAAILVAWFIALGAIFLQIERGTGDRMLVLLFTAFDLLLVAALACSLLVVAQRWRLAILAAPALVLLVYLASWQKMRFSAMAAQAHDIADLVSGWALVAPFAWAVVVPAAAGIALLAALAFVEKPLGQRLPARLLLAVLAVALFAACVRIDDWLPADDHRLLAAGSGPKVALFFRSIYEPPTLEPATVAELKDACCTGANADDALAFRGTVKPNLVIVLQESTFSPTILRGYGRTGGFLLDGAAPLRVHVLGGGTWVEEFSILHGIPATAYGDDYLQINWLGPAHHLEGRLAPLLEREGYRTSSVYPTDGRVLGAKELHRSLGIREFRACSDIAGCVTGRNWTETADSAMFDEVLDILADESRPHFVFTATMRQHSPHVSQYPLSRFKSEIMEEYGRRLALSDGEAQAFVEALQRLRRPTFVLMFGDHIPSDVLAAFDPGEFVADPYLTFFNFYDADGSAQAEAVMRRYPQVAAPDTAFLDALLLDFAGFEGPYIDAKLAFMRRCGGFFCTAGPDE